MRRPCCILVLFTLLAFGLSLAVPAEDVPETAYDESEGLSYEDTPVVSIPVLETVEQAPAVRPRASRFRLGSLRRPGAQHLDHVTGWAYPISDCLNILDRSLRC
jgi:hypothetical protein